MPNRCKIESDINNNNLKKRVENASVKNKENKIQLDEYFCRIFEKTFSVGQKDHIGSRKNKRSKGDSL